MRRVLPFLATAVGLAVVIRLVVDLFIFGQVFDARGLEQVLVFGLIYGGLFGLVIHFWKV